MVETTAAIYVEYTFIHATCTQHTQTHAHNTHSCTTAYNCSVLIACHYYQNVLFQKRANRSQDDKLLGGLNSGAEGLVVASYFDETISPDTSVIESTFEGSTESGSGLKETQDHRRKAEKVDGMKYQFCITSSAC